jgi:regulatory protein
MMLIMSDPTLSEIRITALNLLAMREHSREELHHKLKARGYEAIAINTVLGRLETERLLSDERFAQAYVRMRSRRGFGPTRIRQELVERGVARDIILQSLQDEAIDWFALARHACLKKNGTEVNNDLAQKAKTIRFLIYRGFTQDQITYALEKNDDTQ